MTIQLGATFWYHGRASMSVHSMTEQILGHAACCKRLTVGATLVAARPSSHTHPGSCMCITAEKLKVVHS